MSTAERTRDGEMSEVTGLDYKKIPADEYHADFGFVSNSMLKVFCDSRRMYEAYFVAETLGPPASTKAQDVGTVAHAAILEPHIIERVCLEIPQDVLAKNGARSTNAYKAFAEENSERILMTAAEIAEVRAIFEGVYQNELAYKLLSAAGPVEGSFYSDLENGLRVKCRPDKVLASRPYIIDVKTTAQLSAADFARTATRFRYYQQAVFYRRVLEQLDGEVRKFIHVVVSSKKPYRCHLYELDEFALEYAERELAENTDRLMGCYKTGDWRDPEETQITQLSLPGWLYRQQDYQVE